VDVLYGWIVLEREPGKGELDFEDRDLLKIAGRQVAAHLAQLDADARLAEAHQFETYNRTTAFVMHDLKNIAAQLRLISQNAERHRSNPEFVDDAFGTVASAAARMSKLISQLRAGRDAGTLQTLDLAACAERAAVRCGGTPPVPRLVVEARPTVIADRDNLTAVIEHAIRNAQDATAPTGEVRVEVATRGTRPLVAIIDSGAGMDVQFVRDRLFRPFDTTKGEQGMGIGAFQVREYLRSLGGDVEVASEPGRGTRFTMIFAEQSILPMDRKAV
jgi:putative PEP-CTERM system histidine kinase